LVLAGGARGTAGCRGAAGIVADRALFTGDPLAHLYDLHLDQV